MDKQPETAPWRGNVHTTIATRLQTCTYSVYQKHCANTGHVFKLLRHHLHFWLLAMPIKATKPSRYSGAGGMPASQSSPQPALPKTHIQAAMRKRAWTRLLPKAWWAASGALLALQLRFYSDLKSLVPPLLPAPRERDVLLRGTGWDVSPFLPYLLSENSLGHGNVAHFLLFAVSLEANCLLMK